MKDLTRREYEVLNLFLINDGASDKEIARMIDISPQTVKIHMRGIRRKLGAKNRVHVAIKRLNWTAGSMDAAQRSALTIC